jgi:hypothetical protein
MRIRRTRGSRGSTTPVRHGSSPLLPKAPPPPPLFTRWCGHRNQQPWVDAGACPPAPLAMPSQSHSLPLSFLIGSPLASARVEVDCVVGSCAMLECDSGAPRSLRGGSPHPHHSRSPLPIAGLIPGMKSAQLILAPLMNIRFWTLSLLNKSCAVSLRS